MASTRSFRGDVTYDPELQEMTIDFTEGTYVYHDVPPEVYAAFMSAQSRGSFFNSEIREQYSVS